MQYRSGFLLCMMFFCQAVTVRAVADSNPNLKTSIIIPCCATHAEHLYALVRMYEQQTELPDEIVISLSESHKVPQDIIDALRNETWRFPVKLLLSQEKLFAGHNRNIACENASGDIFICQDADDLVHPQRVEIIKYFFKKYKVKHLMHRFVVLKRDEASSLYSYKDLREIEFDFPKTFAETYVREGITNGNVAIAKTVFNKIKWPSTPRGQDTEFNKEVYARTNRRCAFH